MKRLAYIVAALLLIPALALAQISPGTPLTSTLLNGLFNGKQPLSTSLTTLSGVTPGAFGQTLLGTGSQSGAISALGGPFDVSGAAATVQGLSLQKSSNLSDVQSAATARSNLSAEYTGNKNIANGYAGLDSSGLISSSQLPASGSYLGTWNATTNTPTITSGASTNGNFYIVATAGTTTIDGNSTWAVGDQIRNNGSVWQRVPTNAAVSSVAGKTGAVTLSTTDISGLQVATSSVAGLVKPDGTTLTNTAGALSVTYGTTSSTAAQGNDSRITGALSASTAASTYCALSGCALTGALAGNTSINFTGTTIPFLVPVLDQSDTGNYANGYEHIDLPVHLTTTAIGRAISITDPGGQGASEPNLSAFDLILNADRPNYLTNTNPGAMILENIGGRNGYGDINALNWNVGGVRGFMNGFEGVTQSFNSSGVLQNSIDTQSAVIYVPGADGTETGSAYQAGFVAGSFAGTNYIAYQANEQAGSSWTKWLQFNNPSLIFSLVASGGTFQWADVASGSYVNLSSPVAGGLDVANSTYGDSFKVDPSGLTEALNGLAVTGSISATAAMNGAQSVRAQNGSTMLEMFNDGTYGYLMKSASSATAYDSSRPFTVTLATGLVTLDAGGAGVVTGGALAVGGSLGLHVATWTDTQTCTAGQISVDPSYIYVCTATNTVKRVSLSTF